jgi:prepilin-type N-terminal cleavage/methylation domain-containing protein
MRQRTGGSILVSRRDGFTLVEALMVIVVIGLVSLLGLPKLQHAWAHSNVLSSKAKITSLYARARASAVEGNRTAILVVNGGNAYVVTRPFAGGVGTTFDTITPVENLYTQYRVNLTADVDSARIAPTGLGLNGAQIVLTKGSYADTVVINQYGRILK